MFRKLIRRNLIAMIFPVIVMEVLLIFMTIQVGLLDDYNTFHIDSLEDGEIYYTEGKKNISFDIVGPLEYSGYEVTSEDKRIGKYYYQFNGDNMRLFVLKDETIRKINSGETVTVNARLVLDKVTAAYIEDEYSEETGLGQGVFEGFIDPMIMDELQYPEYRIKGIQYAGILAKILFISTMAYFILALIFPLFASGYNKRKLFKSRLSMLRILDDELDNRLIEKNGAEYITENYIIYAYLSHVEVLKRQDKEADK
ncbi:MAG: hypothetical protein K6E10_02755 [Eubacterium sp.]|nr:hypothetical protein [Eubacterium sp.]